MKKYRILITGVSGYIGAELARKFASIPDYDVIGTSRRKNPNLGIGQHQGDLSDSSFAAKLFKNQRFDFVIHSAGLIRSSDENQLRQSNIVCTANLLSLLESDVRLILFSSDQAVHGVGRYGRSKREVENLVQNDCKNYTILRLAPALGPITANLTSTFPKAIHNVMNKKVLFIPGDGSFIVYPLLIDDLFFVIQKLISTKRGQNKVYGLPGQEITYSSFIKFSEQALNVRRLKIHIPMPMLKMIARMLKLLKILDNLPSDAILEIGNPLPISKDELYADIGFEPTQTKAGILNLLQCKPS
jgi:nucleoside-diphosphate-sugar epimerase